MPFDTSETKDLDLDLASMSIADLAAKAQAILARMAAMDGLLVDADVDRFNALSDSYCLEAMRRAPASMEEAIIQTRLAAFLWGYAEQERHKDVHRAYYPGDHLESVLAPVAS